MKLEEYDGTPEFIAKSLKLPIVEVDKGLNILINLDLVEFRTGRLILKEQTLETTHDIPSDSLKKVHLSFLSQANKALYNIPVKERDFSTMTMAIDETKIPMAKEKIKEFRRSLTKFLTNGKRSKVYTINMQFFPLQKF